MAHAEVVDLRYEQLVRGDTLAEQVYRQLCTKILSGSFAPMERVTVRRLAEDVDVSITPAREAVLRLVADDVLRITDKNAILVPERSAEEIDEIFSIRKTLEGDMVAAAAPQLTDADIQFLEQAQSQFLKFLDVADYKNVLSVNAEFHFFLYKKANLPLHLKITESLWLRVGPTLRYMYPILHKNRSSHRRHEDVIEAASRRDSDALRQALIADLQSSQVALREYTASVNREETARRRLAQTAPKPWMPVFG